MSDLLFLGTAGLGIFLVIRNHVICGIRAEFLHDQNLFSDAYKALPSHDEMVINPKHWKRWTKAQWVAWVEAQS